MLGFGVPYDQDGIGWRNHATTQIPTRARARAALRPCAAQNHEKRGRAAEKLEILPAGRRERAVAERAPEAFRPGMGEEAARAFLPRDAQGRHRARRLEPA